MRIEIVVRRRTDADAAPRLQRFDYEGDGRITVADWLGEANRTVAKGDRIAWECACLERKCGACAMRVNGHPRLACSAYLADVSRDGRVLLEPLSKFPLVRDLVVDRSTMFRTLREMRVWTQGGRPAGNGRGLPFGAGRCLQCGCCLEVCPNFLPDGAFGGAAALAECYKALAQGEDEEHRAELAHAYRSRFYSGCGQSLSCQGVCPIGLPVDELQVRANRLTRRRGRG